MKIDIILQKIDDNQLFVPAFQREYVWKRDNVKQLVDSLIKQYPFGTMLSWQTANPPELKGPHRYNSSQGAVQLLLDGQQRITSLYLLVRGEVPPYYTAAEINDTRGLYVNLETLELLYYIKSRMENNPFWQNITDVFQKKIDAFILQGQVEAAGNQLPRDHLQKINTNINAIVNILERDFPEQIIPPQASIKESIDIFYKVNASGIALTEAELALAQISGYWPEARDLFKKKLSELSNQGFVLRLDFLVYAILACMYSMGSDLRRLHGEENLEEAHDSSGNLVRRGIKDVWATLDSKVLDYVINLLRSKAFVDHTNEISTIYALIPLISFCYRMHGKTIPEAQLWRMVKWFYYSQIRRRYVSQMPQKLDFDLRIVKEAQHPFEELLGVIAEERPLEITPDEMVGRTANHPLYSMMLWYIKSKGAICLTTGLGLHHNMGTSYQLENDYIFPYPVLKRKGFSRQNRLKYAMAQEFTNRALLTQTANRIKSDTAASDYLAQVKVNFPGALELQCIPLDESLWVLEKYEDFLSTRREMLSQRMNDYLNRLAVNDEVIYGKATIEEIISEGESEELEFKSTLRWDINFGKVNKNLEKVIVKTVSAFANTDGGTLLIGVNDEGSVLGLENDYASLNGDRDAFELHLRNLLNQQIGKPFTAMCVKVIFPDIYGEEICQIEVARSERPIILTVKDRHGLDSQKMYIRSGNSSQELSMSEFVEYKKERF